MKRSMFVSVLVIGVLLVVFSFSGIHSSIAVENKQDASTGSQNPGMMQSAPGNSPGMMNQGMMNNQGMGMMNRGMKKQGMMNNNGMDMKKPEMMQMMMSHMMGGPNKMGKMMRQMCMGMMNNQDMCMMNPCMMNNLGMGMMNRGDWPGAKQMFMNLDDLDLTSDQWNQIRTMAMDRLDKMADLWAQRMKMQIQLIGLNWDEEIDPDQVRDIFVKTAEAKAEMVIASMDYMRKLKDILTPEQLKKLESN